MCVEPSFLQNVWKGVCVGDNHNFESVWQSFHENLANENLSELENRYTNCKNDLERINVFKSAFKWTPLSENCDVRFQKSSFTSGKFRENGNIAYKAVDLSNAFRCYNLAIAFAPNETEHQGLAFANRAALFLHINEPELALRDVNLALRYNLYNDETLQKLKTRKLRCEDEFRKKNAISESDSGEIFFQNSGIEYCEEKFLQLKSKSGTLKNAESFLSVKYNDDCGRRLITTQDIAAGTPVLVEEPFVTSLNTMMKWNTTHCAFCTVPILGGLPCPSCTFVFFCNESCLEKGLNTTHKYEHHLIPYLHSTKCFHTDESLLIIRILSKLGPKKVCEMFSQDYPTNYNNSLECKTEQEKSIAGFNYDGVYDSSTYIPVYHLVSHNTPFDFKSLRLLSSSENNIENTDAKNASIPNEFKALLLTEILFQLTDFFKGANIENPIQLKEFVASLVLHHFNNLEFNVLSLAEWSVPSLGPLSQPLWKQKARLQSKAPVTSAYANGVFPLVALCNHSCDPNALFVKCARLKAAAVVTSRKIRAGEEILISYKAAFTRMEFGERREYLLKNYKFLCNCYACARGYSAQDAMSDGAGKEACCEQCQSTASSGHGNKICDRCSFISERVTELAAILQQAQELIRSQKFSQAFQILTKEADFLSEHFQPNYVLFQVTQDLIRRAVVEMLHL